PRAPPGTVGTSPTGPTPICMTPEDFIKRWQGSAAAELSNSQLFLSQLCRLLEVDEPDPSVQDEAHNTLKPLLNPVGQAASLPELCAEAGSFGHDRAFWNRLDVFAKAVTFNNGG